MQCFNKREKWIPRLRKLTIRLPEIVINLYFLERCKIIVWLINILSDYAKIIKLAILWEYFNLVIFEVISWHTNYEITTNIAKSAKKIYQTASYYTEVRCKIDRWPSNILPDFKNDLNPSTSTSWSLISTFQCSFNFIRKKLAWKKTNFQVRFIIIFFTFQWCLTREIPKYKSTFALELTKFHWPEKSSNLSRRQKWKFPFWNWNGKGGKES